MDIVQAIAGYAVWGLWYAILGIFGIVGFVVNHWLLSIVLGMIIVMILYALWSNSEREFAAPRRGDQSADAIGAETWLNEQRHQEKRPDWL
ncbi:hypothetical protein [Bradyrhizobium sp. B120]|uniref:hypothetical protein n=1 Tax=Bradyrhizobium sp. B120 TaxID=3410088 RepID=UPI003B9876D4